MSSNRHHVHRFILPGILIVLFWSLSTCGQDNPTSSPVASRIVIAPSALTLSSVGQTDQLLASVRDQQDRPIRGASVQWSSSNSSVATVSATGLVTAVSAGTAMITARSGAVSQSIRVTVMEWARAVTLSPSSAELAPGDTLRFVASAVYADGRAVAEATFTWRSSNVSVATVDTSGLVTAISAGKATITSAFRGVYATAAITVSNLVPTRIDVTPALVTFTSLGETAQLAAVVVDQHGRPLADAAVQWWTSNSYIATVSATGLVTAAGEGAAEITARSGAVSATIHVSIMQRVRAITLSPSSAAMATGDTLRLAASAIDFNDHTVADAAYVWTSSNEGVAAVDVSGLVTAVSPGTADISAAFRGLSAFASITVSIPDRIELVALYHATDGPHWTQAGGWLGDGPLDGWHGVTTDGSGLVIALSLDGNNLSGALPAELGDLDRLSRLDVSHNPLEGVIPASLIRLGLEVLDLEDTGLCAPSTTEYEAWLEGIGERTGIAWCENPDRDILIALYHAMDGPNWRRQSGWLTDAPLNQWFGVTTDRHGRVIGLNVNDGGLINNLKGQLPPELGNLSSLQFLDISFNQLTGPIPPELGNLSNLQTLELYGNQLSGSIPSELVNLSNLRALYLYNNQLSGALPSDLGGLARLDTLSLSGNHLSGAIPPELGNLSNLRVLRVYDNQLSGALPPEIANLKRLEELNLHENALSGPIPPELGNLSSLRDLFLGSNQLTGPIPPELANLSRLTHLYLDQNQLTGSVPSDLADLSSLEDLNLSLNELSGGIPSWLGDLTLLGALVLHGNQFTGQIPPDLGKLTSLHNLRLHDNDLSGGLPHELGNLSNLWALTASSNRLTGAVPLSLSSLHGLRILHLEDTGLCVFSNAAFEAWLDGVEEKRVPDPCTDPDRDVLAVLYHAAGGPNWHRRSGWLGDGPLNGWQGVTTDSFGRVIGLTLEGNNLSGALPAEVGALDALTGLSLGDNALSGPLPQSLGNLVLLEHLDLGGNPLTGPVPLSLSGLEHLELLHLDGTALCVLSDADFQAWLEDIDDVRVSACASGGDRDVLTTLYHALGGPGWRSDEGWLSDLPFDGWHGIQGSGLHVVELSLPGNNLSGRIPAIIGSLSGLETLRLDDNQLSGPLPSALGELSDLRHLILHRNEDLTGPLPHSLTGLDLETLRLDNTGLCAPRDPAFEAWLAGIADRRVAPCLYDMEARAYLAQAVQSLDFPVPLVAGERAFLRVFVTKGTQDGATMPPVRATFYHGGTPVHTVEIPAQDTMLPAEIDEGSLSSSANAEVPARVVAPGLEMVIEIAPYGAADFSGGAGLRLPETGRTAVEVKEMPPLDLTIVPFLWTEYPDRTILSRTGGLAAGDDLFWQTRDLLPVGDFNVTVRDFAWSSVDPVFENIPEIVGETRAIRALDGADGHYMGVLRDRGGGQASLSGRVSVVPLEGSVIAHELGHNMSLRHAPCVPFLGGIFGGPGGVDPLYPYPHGRIGSWGYNMWSHDIGYIRSPDNDMLVPPEISDLMGYCDPVWISDYHFTKALKYRHTVETDDVMASASPRAAADPGYERALLLWGSRDESGGLELMPAFVVDAAPFVPAGGGPYRLTGEDGGGRALFTVRFTMGEVAHGEGGAFAFVVPAPASWASRLARITLAGPEGRVSIDAAGDRAAALLRDRLTGRVRGLLREVSSASMMPGGTGARVLPPEPGLEIEISRGIPERYAW